MILRKPNESTRAAVLLFPELFSAPAIPSLDSIAGVLNVK
jgi:hypothetical protein